MKFHKLKFSGLQVISLYLIFVLFFVCGITVDKHLARLRAEEAVRLMYDFVSPEELAGNMERLSKICSKDVYEKLTIDNEDKTLQTYLKFKNKPVSVKILECTNNYVLYSLETEYISAEREFIFTYKCHFGKIVDANEMECISFY